MEVRERTEMNEVVFYGEGLVYLSACAAVELDGVAVALRANRDRPSGVTPWAVADEEFRTGETNPCPCNTEADRRHWLLRC